STYFLSVRVFSSSSSDHLHLHSFPTRRSSDLSLSSRSSSPLRAISKVAYSRNSLPILAVANIRVGWWETITSPESTSYAEALNSTPFKEVKSTGTDMSTSFPAYRAARELSKYPTGAQRTKFRIVGHAGYKQALTLILRGRRINGKVIKLPRRVISSPTC